MKMGLSEILILYGSQTGTAEDVAERLTREAINYGILPTLTPMNLISLEEISEKWKGDGKAAIFVCSTTGQGDTPDNMKSFWKILCRKTVQENIFNGLQFGVIGLGDSSYEKYNFVGKKLFRRLKQLGATSLQDICLGDDQHDLGPDAALDPWIDILWTQLISPDIRASLEIEAKNRRLEPKFFVRTEKEVVMQNGGTKSEKNFEFRKLIENKRATHPEHFQDVRLITIELENSQLTYEPGDVVMILPSNLENNVDQFFKLFPLIDRFEAVYLEKNVKIPWASIPVEIKAKLGAEPWTWESIVRNLLDIQCAPRRYFFELLSKFTQNELEKEKLEEFSRPEGQQDLFSYCNRPKRNILEILQDFRHATENIPADFLFDLIPMIKPRAFSIASSMRAFPTALQILVAVVKYSTKLKTSRFGLCSNWLASLSIGSSLLIWIQKGSFRFPAKDENAAVIMIGPGTGCAPFRSFISNNFDSQNSLVLFFGCRNQDMDFYFQDEWTQLDSQGFLKLIPAFSRPTPEQNCTRQYVQQQMKKHKEYLQRLPFEGQSSRKVYIYVAGNAKQMPIDVLNAFQVIYSEEFVKSLSRLGFYQTEVWS